MEQLTRQNAQTKILNKILGAEDTLLDSGKRKQKEMIKKKRPITRCDSLINYFSEKIKIL